MGEETPLYGAGCEGDGVRAPKSRDDPAEETRLLPAAIDRSARWRPRVLLNADEAVFAIDQDSLG